MAKSNIYFEQLFPLLSTANNFKSSLALINFRFYNRTRVNTHIDGCLSSDCQPAAASGKRKSSAAMEKKFQLVIVR
jgi:hypothetical protein